MEQKTAEALISALFATSPDAVSFVFQGGEPLLAGLEFYRQFVNAVGKHNRTGARVSYSLQTNGALIDENFCRFFRKHNVLIGLSLDGPKELNDKNRLDQNGKSTFSAVMKGASLLREAGVEFNILTVLTDHNARYPEKLYRFFRANGFDYLQFIPCIGEGEAQRLSPERLGSFLKRTFDLWYEDAAAGNPVYIRQFENYVTMLCGLPAEDCSMNGRCGVYYVAEADGSLYPCDFYCTDPHRLGSVFDPDPFSISQKHKEFLCRSHVIPENCQTCRWYALCRGGCYRDRSEDDRLNRYCKGYQAFFEYAEERLRRMASAIQAARTRNGGN